MENVLEERVSELEMLMEIAGLVCKSLAENHLKLTQMVLELQMKVDLLKAKPSDFDA